MNSLEWINKQILLVKQNIQYHKDLLAESEEEYTDEIISAIKLLEPELQTLLQIKKELKAWHSTKPYFVDLGDVYVLAISKDDKAYQPLKKALEVNNNIKKKGKDK